MSTQKHPNKSIAVGIFFGILHQFFVDSLLFGHMRRVYILKIYSKGLRNVRFQHF